MLDMVDKRITVELAEKLESNGAVSVLNDHTHHEVRARGIPLTC